ncbi:beta-lactamase/transpeptidase-like protein [Penicillium verrucosum]|uniref:beta-lactamase/transpeptidase-like protein n=1 Tax=Penicillium verrucosum TaxID=60171 RepID=UPI00254584E5|nr:beta-lactamase/transpeptidase-like protein [Penicillium verrucosum]KAJ5941543.1 beta-lactamase/transpeptidase-like protein [Penicillium verrucosum]
MYFIKALMLVAFARANAAAASGPASTTSLPSTSASAKPTTIPYVDYTRIGTFNLTSLDSTNPANSAIRTRHEEELLVANRTIQLRHGSKLRQLHQGKLIEVSADVNGSLESIDSFMAKFGMAGLIVVQHGTIRVEKYLYGNSPASKNVIQSCTKSFTSTALAVAMAAGKISTNDLASKYVPELVGSPYENVSLLQISDMVSGVTVPDDVPDYFDIYLESDPEAVFRLFKQYKTAAPPGQVYNYLDQNYYVIAVAVSRAVGEPIESYIQRNIWEPAGMQYDGFMRATAAGQVDGHGGLGITLGDMARFALYILDNINGKGGPKVPAGWFHNIAKGSTSTGIRAPGAIDIIPSFGYQTGWWTLPRGGDKYQLGDDFAFAALGTYDQAIYVIPGLNATIAMQSSFPVSYPELFYHGQEFATAVALALKTC